MRNWLLPVAMFFPLVLSGQADTSQFIPTSETRDSREFIRQEIIEYNTVSWPDLISPYLKVMVAKWTFSQETHERRYVDRNVLSPSQRVSLQLARFLGRPTDNIVQGLPEKSMTWKRENEFLPPRHELGRDIPLLITAKDSTWTVRTDNSGMVKINIDNYSHLSEEGLLQVRVALEETPYIMKEYSFSPAKSAWAPPNRMLLKEAPAGTMADRAAPADREAPADRAAPKKLDLTPWEKARAAYAGETRELVETPSLPSERELEKAPADTKADRAAPIRSTETSEARELIETPSLPPEREPAAPSLEDRPVIAILDFDGYGVSQMEALVLTNRLGTHLVQLGTHQVIERGQMEQILKEQDFQISGCTSNECAVEVGRVLGCELMLAGSFGKIGSIYTIDMRIIDVTSGGILRTTSYDVRGDVESLLTEGLAGAVRRITQME